jgi:tetratricopeptide (TPR) repeat protein
MFFFLSSRLVLLLHIFQVVVLASVPSSKWVVQGDLAFEKRNQKNELQFALDCYKKAAQDESQFVEASWKYSMALQSFTTRFIEDEEKQAEFFKEAAEVARKASEQNPECGPCEFWTAINLALYGERIGVFKMLGSLSEIISRLEKAAALEPAHAMAGPYRVLGTIYQVLPGIIGGDNEKALFYLEKAISLTPLEPINYLAMAKLRDLQGQRDLAKQYSLKGLSLVNHKNISLESRESYQELEVLSR